MKFIYYVITIIFTIMVTPSFASQEDEPERWPSNTTKHFKTPKGFDYVGLRKAHAKANKHKKSHPCNRV